MTHPKREIAVIGGGLIGFSTAIALAAEGYDTVLIAPTPLRKDGRSTALIGASASFLESNGILERIADRAEPLKTMRIVDDTNRLLRAPTVEFQAVEIGLQTFGYNVLNADLMRALKARAGELDRTLTMIAHSAVDIRVQENEVRVALDNGETLRASLVIGADGRNSIVRKRSRIEVREWSYPQTALVLNFRHEAGHDNVSTEFHTQTGPFTQVPLPGRRSSLVWVEKPLEAERLLQLTPDRLALDVERKMHSLLGKVEIDGSVQSFPLSGSVAKRLTGRRAALVGEAAHVFPPIGAQGLNLGLRDVAAIVDAVKRARDDPGRAAVLRRYEAMRRGDILSRTIGVDALNRSLLSDFLPVQAARCGGLFAMALIPPFRRLAMREGALPGASVFGFPDNSRG